MFRVLSGKPTCRDDLDCNGNGVCSIASDEVVCACNAGFGGRFCQWNKTDFELSANKTKNLVTAFKNQAVSAENAEAVTSTLTSISKMGEFLEADAIEDARLKIEAIVAALQANPRNDIAQNLLASLGNFVKEIRDRTTFTKEQRRQRIVSLIATKEKVIDLVASVITVGTEIVATSPFFDIRIRAITPGGTSTLELASEGTVYRVPSSALSDYLKVVVVIEKWYVDLYNGDRLLTPTTRCTLKNNTKEISIQNLGSTPITLYVPKTSPTPVLSNSTQSAFTCSYYDPQQNNFSTSGVTFAGENVTHIFCNTTHLTEFAVKMNSGAQIDSVSIDQISATTQANIGSIVSGSVSGDTNLTASLSPSTCLLYTSPSPRDS
eukprot:TRINITY_DN127_c0_g1_i1.p1 TRINITY_DN127_c0_g1~~TRINITY_DN127_c0_g1_i1.p1  ORF type:complete len:378 (-),score=91.95 TRINITY_DN127_c0_g1_i1:39-1172(-)